MDKNRITGKIVRLTAQRDREVSNRDYALRCARDSMAGDPSSINASVIGNVVAALAKAATMNATIERLDLEIQSLQELSE